LLIGHHDERTASRIASALDRMDPDSRLTTVLSIEAHDQPVLWELVSGNELSAEHFVPSDVDPLVTVIHQGKNTLPAAKLFQKRFCRTDQADKVWGYNAQPFAWLTGPGYFVGHTAESGPAKYVIDYTELPPSKPDDWPRIASNTSGIGRLVYGNMKDYVRAVSSHVCIGRAYRGDEPMAHYFVLCRRDPAPSA
jgi:hypothetical protein